MCSLPEQEAQFPKSARSILNQKSTVSMSNRVLLAMLVPRWIPSGPHWHLQNTFKTHGFSTFHFLAQKSPHIEASKSPSKAFKLHCWLSGHIFHDFCNNVLPAQAGSTIFKIDTKHFELTNHFFDVESGTIEPLLKTFFRSYRSFVSSFPFLVGRGPSLDRQN